MPHYMGARLKRAAYGLNDAPRLWWNRLDKALTSYGLVPTRADRCCYVLYDKKPVTEVWEAKKFPRKRVHFTGHDGDDGVSTLFEAETFEASKTTPTPKCVAENLDEALEHLLDPITGSKGKGMIVLGILTIHVDDVYLTGGAKFRDRVVGGLHKDYMIITKREE